MNARAASGFFALFSIATGSVTAGTPSLGNTKPTGEPSFLALSAMKSTTMPNIFSPPATSVSTAPLPATEIAPAAASRAR
jgi:hypothetical protein